MRGMYRSAGDEAGCVRQVLVLVMQFTSHVPSETPPTGPVAAVVMRVRMGKRRDGFDATGRDHACR